MRITSLLLCCIPLFLAACRSDEKSTEGNQEEATVQEAAGPGPEITTIGFTRKDTVLGYALDITYPAIRGDEVFNAAVGSGMEAAIDEFTAFIQQFQDSGNVMRSEYQLIQNTSRVASVRQMYEWAVPGVSTLQYRFYNVNYNPEAQELIPLESLFPQGVPYRSFLRERLSEKIRSRFQVEVEVTDEDLQTYVIGPEYLEFYKVLYPDVLDPEPKAFQVKFSEWKNKWK